MNTFAPSLDAPAPAAQKRPWFNPRAWSGMMPALSTAALIVAVIALIFSAFGPGGVRNGDNDGPGHFAAAPVATVSPDDISTTRPYPGPNECTVEPMTREELIEHLKQANTATLQQYPYYEHSIEPTEEQRDAILQTYSAWFACGQDTPDTGPAYQLRLESPWFTGQSLPIFLGFVKQQEQHPISEDELLDYADVLLRTAPEATPSTMPVIGTPPAYHIATPEWVPLPPDATPVERVRGGSFPTLFADDIEITGPQTARAQVVFVDRVTNEVIPGLAYNVGFVLVDGQWLMDSYVQVGTQS